MLQNNNNKNENNKSGNKKCGKTVDFGKLRAWVIWGPVFQGEERL